MSYSITIIANIVAISLVASAFTASSGQILWSSRPLAENYTSHGVTDPIDGSFTFELGTFANNFSPSGENTGQWAENWRTADRAAYNPETRFFGSSYVISDEASPFVPGLRIYIWGYDQSGEWILVSNPRWTWPISGGLQFPDVISISSATETIVGHINDTAGHYHMKTAKVPEGHAPKPTATQWQSKVFSVAQRQSPAISGWEADPDRDGLTNHMELAFGGHPLTPEPERVPVIRRVEIGGVAYLELRASKPDENMVRVKIEASSDLKHWQADDPHFEDVSGDDPSVLVFRRRVLRSTGQPFFLRLGITLLELTNR